MRKVFVVMRASSQLSKKCAYLAEVTRGIQRVPFRILAAFFINVHVNVERKDIQGNEATPLDTTVKMTAQLSSCIWNEHQTRVASESISTTLLAGGHWACFLTYLTSLSVETEA